MGGCFKYRSVDCHLNLMKNYPDEFNVDFVDEIPFDKEYIQRYQIIQIHRLIDEKTLNFLKTIDIKIVCDLDDYWEINNGNNSSKLSNQLTINLLQKADLVTCTTGNLAIFLKKYNKNVEVLPNAVDPNEKQFINKKIESDKIRFGYLGGSTHLEDVKLLTNFGQRFNEIKNGQIILCGYDIRGIVTEINKVTGEQKSRYITPEESIYLKYEKILTNNYQNLSKDYIQFLNEYKDIDDSQFKNESYKRIWTKPITTYATTYNQIDISLAPLVYNNFNAFKSQLKIIEAGFHHIPIIASNICPYNIDLINYRRDGGEIDPKGNALLVDKNKNHKNWFKYAKLLADNEELRFELGEKLYEAVKDEYNQNNVSIKRMQLYKHLVK